MADYSVEIASLELILNAGTKAVSVDGLSTQLDLDAVERRLRYLRSLDDFSIAAGMTRPKHCRIRMNNTF